MSLNTENTTMKTAMRQAGIKPRMEDFRDIAETALRACDNHVKTAANSCAEQIGVPTMPRRNRALLLAALEIAVGVVLDRMKKVSRVKTKPKRRESSRTTKIRTQALELRRIDEVKIAAFDKIVELLDCFLVGDKKLGDCTRSDLLRAARALETESEDMQLRASFYKELAKMVGKGTVREASNRGQIVGLLTTTFSQ